MTYLTITEKGRMLSQVFDSAFFAQLTPLLADVSDEDAATTIRTIEKVYQVMSERRIHFEQ